MANKRLTDLTELTTPADNDFFYIVDVSDTTESPQGTSKKIRKDKVDSGASKENIANKQNDLTPDGTGTKYPTVDAVNTKVSNIDNTSDANKPVSTATQTALKGVYNGQTWGVLGDSFGQLGIYQPALLSRLGITTITNAQGGACITGGTEYIEGDGLSRVPLVNRIDSMLLNSITGIIIQGGSNDFHYSTNIGFFGSTDTNTMYGALDYICSKIANHPTKLKAVFITPTFRGDAQKFGGSTGLANYEKMKPYVTAIKIVASKYSIQVVDEFGAGINYYNTDVYTTDGIHPNNPAGEELYNNFLVSNINSGTLDVPTLEVITSYDEYPTFRKSIYWNKHGADLQDDAAIVVTNGVDSDLRFKTTAIGALNKYSSIGTGKIGVNLAIQELYGKVLIGTNASTDDTKLQVLGSISADSPNGALYRFKINGVNTGFISNTFNMDGVGNKDDLGSYVFGNNPYNIWTNGVLRTQVSGDGIFKISNLAGTGTRTVVADASGNLLTDSTVYAPLSSPALTGTPTATTAAAGTNTTQIATTAFAQGIRPYKVYTALLTQTGTNAPTAIILENTIGAIVWSRSATGMYIGTLSGAFTVDKTLFGIMGIGALTQNTAAMSAYVQTINGVRIDTTLSGTFTDAMMTSVPIEIRVYN